MPVVASAAQRPRDRLEPATEDRYNFRFSAGKAFTEKVRRFAEVLAVPSNYLGEILDQALEIALEKKDPQRKLERRRTREAKKESPNPRPGDAEHEGKATPSREEPRRDESGSPAPSRHIPSEVRERVLERANYQCEFCGPDGSRCSSRTGLEVEHTRPFAVYHSHDERYLRIYCPAHNLQAARKYYGEDFIRGKIDAARRGLTIGSTA
jgi:5-methylcytosine-specific restriction endonuclease McrA